MTTYQTFAPFDCTTLTDYMNWAQVIGTGLAAIGLVKQTADGAFVNWPSYIANGGTVPVSPGSGGLPRPTIYRFQGAWTSGNSYTGASAANGTNDIVTFNGITYICMITKATDTTVPTSDLYNGTTGTWTPYNYEVWKTNDAASSTNPIYIKLVYGANGTTVLNPWMNVTVGTVYNTTSLATGTVTGNLMDSAGTPPEFAFGATAGVTSTTFEMDFQSSDGGSFSMCLWRGYTDGSASLIIDRARDQNGNALDTYVSVYVSPQNIAGGRYQILFKPGTGGTWPSVTTGWSTGCPTIFDGVQNSGATNGTVPFRPVFPLVGYVANPMLQMGVVFSNDGTEGGLMNVALYGSMHTFMITKVNGPAVNSSNNNALAFRWE